MIWADLKRTLSISSSWVVTRLIPHTNYYYILSIKELTYWPVSAHLTLFQHGKQGRTCKVSCGKDSCLPSPSKFPDMKVLSLAIIPPLPAAREATYLLCVTASSSKMLNSQLSSLSSNWAMQGGTSLMVIGIARWLWLWCTSGQTDGVGEAG